MRKQLEIAMRAAESARLEIAKLVEKLDRADPRLDVADEVLLGASWTLKRLKELAAAFPQASN